MGSFFLFDVLQYPRSILDDSPFTMKNQISISLWLLLLWAACGQPSRDLPISPVGQNILQLPHAQRFPAIQAEVYLVDHFLTDTECDQLVSIIKNHLVPSRVTAQDTEPDKYKDQKIRTSSTAYLSLLSDPVEKAFVDTIQQKISDVLGIPSALQEGIQGQHYCPGQEFKEHLDAFTPDTKEWIKVGGPVRGNRTWPVMIYLNNVEQGGGTYFSRLNHRFLPQKAQAVIWNNLYDDGRRNLAVYHSGEPVEKGEKTIITQWFRQYSKAAPQESSN